MFGTPLSLYRPDLVSRKGLSRIPLLVQGFDAPWEHVETTLLQNQLNLLMINGVGGRLDVLGENIWVPTMRHAAVALVPGRNEVPHGFWVKEQYNSEGAFGFPKIFQRSNAGPTRFGSLFNNRWNLAITVSAASVGDRCERSNTLVKVGPQGAQFAGGCFGCRVEVLSDVRSGFFHVLWIMETLGEEVSPFCERVR